ncbi:MAG: TolC family protein [Candidatus Aureabacteria bacterium]|nr:TolC family protein [Candidatus Auribacterota bacterium]
MIKIFHLAQLSLFVFLAFFLLGCRTLRAPETPYESWQAPEWAKPTEVKDGFWTSIRARKLDTDEPLTLSELVAISFENNPATRQYWQAARAKEAGLSQARSKWYPQADVSAQVGRQKQQFNEGPTTDVTTYGPEADITYLILDFGGRNAEVEGALQELLASNFQFNQSIQDLLLEVETAYYTFFSAQAAVNVAEADVADARTAYVVAQQKFEAGLVTRLDVLQAKSNLDDALYSLEDAKGNEKTAKGNLAKAIGFSADTDFSIAPPKNAVPREIKTEEITVLIDQALENRPDISSLKASVRAKEAAVRSANSDLWPSITGGASADKNWHHDYELDNNTRDNEYMGYIKVEWDVFDGFYNLSRKRQAQAEAEQEKANLIQAEIDASSDVWIKFYSYKTAVSKLVFSEAFLASSKESYELALEGYSAGLKDILDLLDAQAKLSDARSKLVDSKKGLFIAVAELAHATGALGSFNENISD